MTPTEQDKVLREGIISILRDSKLDIVDDADDIMQLITADRKRVALEARIDELEKANSLYSRTYEQKVTDNFGGLYVTDSKRYISSYEVEERIAELKSQQEEE